MIEFVSDGSHVIDLTVRGGPRLRVYATYNPSTVANREALNYLIGLTVLIDGVARVVHSVESFCIGGAYAKGRAIGLAVEELTHNYCQRLTSDAMELVAGV